MDSTSRSVADTIGWGRTEQEGFGIAQQTGESEAWTTGNSRNITQSKTVTNSSSVSDGTSDSFGYAETHGMALTEGESQTVGESLTLSPFHDYVREETKVPTFLTPEEQRLLEMQKLYRPKKQHMVVIAPDNADCLVRVPDVEETIIPKRRLAAGLESVHAQLQCYITVEQINAANDGSACGSTDLVDVEVEEVPASAALPSPAPEAVDEDEATLWARWKNMGRGLLKKS
jgi:hypothetical protein